MIRIAIVEDDTKQTALLEQYLKRYCEGYAAALSWRAYPSGEAFLDDFYAGKYDIVLLDIQMAHIDGIETAREVRKADDHVMIIFITNLVQYVIQGYSVQALDFIVKPVEYALFEQKLAGAVARIHKTMQGTVSFKVADGIVHLRPHNILYFEIVARKLYICTNDSQTYRCSDTLNNIEARLDDTRFFRCHAGYLVNVAYVSAIKKDHALIGGKHIPISKYRRKEFLDAVGNYLGSGL